METQQQARVAIDLMTRELMMIGAGLSVDRPRFVTMKDEELSFYSNLTGAMARLTQDTDVGMDVIPVFYVKRSNQFRSGKTVAICSREQCEWNDLARQGGKRTLQLSKKLKFSYPRGSAIQIINQVSYHIIPQRDGQSRLIRKVDKGASPVAEGISLLRFKYLGSMGSTVGRGEEVSRIGIQLTTTISGKNRLDVSLHSEVYVRN